MRDAYRVTLSKKLELLTLWWQDVLMSPVWYVIVMAGLASLAVYSPMLRWGVAVLALIWGGWLIRQPFRPERAAAAGTEPAQVYLEQALMYQTQLHQLLAATANRHNSRHRQHLAGRIDTWTEAIVALVQHITVLRQDDLLGRDLEGAPQALEVLRTRLTRETDPTLRLQLERALNNRHKQVTALARLQQSLLQAELQVENTVSQLGILYSQLLTDQSTHQVVDYDRLSADLEEAVSRLQDQLVTLGEVRGAVRAEY